LDWLNEITDERFNFFGLEIELWRIGDSAIAPKFNVVCKPNDWSRTVSETVKTIVASELTDAKRLQLEFWTKFVEYARDNAKLIKPRSPRPQHWMPMALGRVGFHLFAVASLSDSITETFEAHEVRAEVILNGPTAKIAYAALEAQKSQIEKELGESLDWYNPPDKQSCKMFFRKPANLEDRDQWPTYFAWLVEKLDALHRVFSQRVKNLDLDELENE